MKDFITKSGFVLAGAVTIAAYFTTVVKAFDTAHMYYIAGIFVPPLGVLQGIAIWVMG